MLDITWTDYSVKPKEMKYIFAVIIQERGHIPE